jgi:hypothetical protein
VYFLVFEADDALFPLFPASGAFFGGFGLGGSVLASSYFPGACSASFRFPGFEFPAVGAVVFRVVDHFVSTGLFRCSESLNLGSFFLSRHCFARSLLHCRQALLLVSALGAVLS